MAKQYYYRLTISCIQFVFYPPPSHYAHAAASTDSLTLDSFVGGSEMEFPSLTDLDSSLALGQFPSGDYSIMPTISEQVSNTSVMVFYQSFVIGH